MQELVKLALSSNKQDQRKVYQMVKQLEGKQEGYIQVLKFIFNNDQSIQLRSMASLILKGMLQRHLNQLPSPLLTHLLTTILHLFASQPPQLCKTLSLILNLCLQNHLDLSTLQFLLNLAQSKHPQALTCLKQIIQDTKDLSGMVSFLSKLLKTLLALCQTPQVKLQAMSCFNTLIFPMPPKLVGAIAGYMGVLLRGIGSGEKEVQEKAMEGLRLVAETRGDFLGREVLREVAIRQSKDQRYNRHQCGFWQEVVKLEGMAGEVMELLDVLAVKWFNWLVYTPQDQAKQMQDSTKNKQSPISSTLRSQTLFLFQQFTSQHYDSTKGSHLIYPHLRATLLSHLSSNPINPLYLQSTLLLFSTSLQYQYGNLSSQPIFQPNLLQILLPLNLPRLTTTFLSLLKQTLPMKNKTQHYLNFYLNFVFSCFSSNDRQLRVLAGDALQEFVSLNYGYDCEIAAKVGEVMQMEGGLELVEEVVERVIDRRFRVPLEEVKQGAVLGLWMNLLKRWERCGEGKGKGKEEGMLLPHIARIVIAYPTIVQPFTTQVFFKCQQTLLSRSCPQLLTLHLHLLLTLLQHPSNQTLHHLPNLTSLLLSSLPTQSNIQLQTLSYRILARIIKFCGLEQNEETLWWLKTNYFPVMIGAQYLCLQEYGGGEVRIEGIFGEAVREAVREGKKGEKEVTDWDRVVGRCCLYEVEGEAVRHYFQNRRFQVRENCDQYLQQAWRGFFTIILKYPELQKIKWKGLKEFKNQLYPEEQATRLYNLLPLNDMEMDLQSSDEDFKNIDLADFD